MNDKITVAEDYCLACKGSCTNDDPADFEHMMVEWDALSGAWQDRGADANDIWSFLASVLIAIAQANGIALAEFQEVLGSAWRKGEEDA